MIDASAVIAGYQDVAEENPDAEWIDRILAAVRRYRSAGFRCIPLKPRDKAPVENDRMGSVFAIRASAVERTIREAFERNPGANLGVLIEGGIVVLDVDVRHGGDAAWGRLTAGIEMPETATAETGCRECEPKRGRHYLFRLPADAGAIRGKLPGFDGIEIKSAGYIVVEPSVHPKSGAAYRWIRRPDDGIAELPAEILARIRKPPAATVAEIGVQAARRHNWDVASLQADIRTRFPIERPGQRNGRTSQAIASLAGRGLDDETVLAVVDPFLVEAVRSGRSRASERKALAAARDILAATRRNPAFVSSASADEIWAGIRRIELDDRQREALDGEFGRRRRNVSPLTCSLGRDAANPDDREEPKTCNRTNIPALLTPDRRAFVEALTVMTTYETRRGRTTEIAFTHDQISRIAVERGLRGEPWEDTPFNRHKTLFFKRIPGKRSGRARATEDATLEELFVELSKGSRASGEPSLYRPTGMWRLLFDTPKHRASGPSGNVARGPPWRVSGCGCTIGRRASRRAGRTHGRSSEGRGRSATGRERGKAMSAGIRKKAGKWYYYWTDESGKRRERAGCADKRATEEMLRAAQTTAAKTRAGLIDPKAARVVECERRPVGEHVAEYIGTMRAKGLNAQHVAQTANACNRIVEHGGIRTLSGITPSAVLAAVSKLRAENRAPRTINLYITAIKQFSRFAWIDGRVLHDPLAGFKKVDETADRRVVRRALSEAELRAVVDAARRGPVVFGVAGADRAILYSVAASTGFRKGELMSLRPEWFNLDGEPPTIVCEGAYTKSGARAEQPIPASLAAVLRAWIASRPPNVPVFPKLPPKTGRMIATDLRAAGIEPVDSSGRRVDLHALRHSYISILSRAGVPAKTLQTLARHSTPTLTLNVYSHISIFDTSAALVALPDLASVAGSSSVVAATGTHGPSQHTSERLATHLPQPAPPAGPAAPRTVPAILDATRRNPVPSPALVPAGPAAPRAGKNCGDDSIMDRIRRKVWRARVRADPRQSAGQRGACVVSDGLKRVYGIDLGTTYSAIAYVDEHGKPVIVPNQESERITPSVVLFDGENVIVGNTAKEAAKVEPHRVVSRVKQHMGDPNFVFEYEGQAYSPEDISSFVLRKVVGDAQVALALDEPITDVVITCPAYFGTPEREATANAGRLAGLNVRAILNEPTAAAVAYGLEQGEDQTVLVYDLGGGTFDITMIEIKDRLIRVICTGGDHRLGGALWDEALVMALSEDFQRQTGEGSDPLDDPEVLNDLFLQSERGKKTLTQRDKAPFRVTHAGKQARVEVDRPQFETITRHLLDRTIELTREMLTEAAAKGHTTYDKIILVGGATRMPQVRNRIVEEFGVEPETFDPDEAVAKGAALYGLKESLSDEVREMLAANEETEYDEDGGPTEVDLTEVSDEQVAEALDRIEKSLGYTLTGPVRELVNTQIVNVLSKSLGVVAKDEKNQEVVVYLLPRNGEVPMEFSTDFGTDQANQAGVDIQIKSGEKDSPAPADCQDVGTATLELPTGLPARSPIRVKFAINRDGRLIVTATDLTGGASINVEFETEAVLSAGEVEERSTALRLLTVS